MYARRSYGYIGVRVCEMNDACINTANNKKLRLRWNQYNNYISISANKNQQPSLAALDRTVIEYIAIYKQSTGVESADYQCLAGSVQFSVIAKLSIRFLPNIALILLKYCFLLLTTECHEFRS